MTPRLCACKLRNLMLHLLVQSTVQTSISPVIFITLTPPLYIHAFDTRFLHFIHQQICSFFKNAKHFTWKIHLRAYICAFNLVVIHSSILIDANSQRKVQIETVLIHDGYRKRESNKRPKVFRTKKFFIIV